MGASEVESTVVGLTTIARLSRASCCRALDHATTSRSAAFSTRTASALEDHRPSSGSTINIDSAPPRDPLDRAVAQRACLRRAAEIPFPVCPPRL